MGVLTERVLLRVRTLRGSVLLGAGASEGRGLWRAGPRLETGCPKGRALLGSGVPKGRGLPRAGRRLRAEAPRRRALIWAEAAKGRGLASAGRRPGLGTSRGGGVLGVEAVRGRGRLGGGGGGGGAGGGGGGGEGAGGGGGRGGERAVESGSPLGAGRGKLPEGVELSVYRIVQEALTNVVKHAAPARCLVSVVDDGRVVRIEVADDGPGHRTLPGKGTGHGLIRSEEHTSELQ